MKSLLLILVVAIAMVDPATVRKINSAKSAAEDAFKSGDYSTAVRHYRYLVDTLGVNEDEVLLNMANAYYLLKDTANAVSTYHSVSQSEKPVIRSKAHQQLGILSNQQGRHEEALSHFKDAIKAEPTNEDARYNYEMLKKKLEEKKKQEEEKQKQNPEKQDQQQQDQQNQDQQDQQNKDQQKQEQEKKEQEQKEREKREQEKSEQEQKDKQEQQQEEKEQKESEKQDMQNLDREKLEQMKISEEKARMILEAMKNQEKQYLQQQRRKPTKSRDRNKPDW